MTKATKATKGDKGDKGDPGLDPDLTHICNINWKHGEATDPGLLKEMGLLIAFDNDVWNEDIHRHSIRVLVEEVDRETMTACWCELLPAGWPNQKELQLQGVRFKDLCEPFSGFEEIFPAGEPGLPANGARFFPARGFETGRVYRVIVQGDFIRDVKERAVDGDHLPPYVPNRRSGDGLEGGTFESWFVLGDKLVNINRATAAELTAVAGIGPEIATAIIAHRTDAGNFQTLAQLINVPGIGEKKLAQLRSVLTL
ncbi:MAG: helix-hairpin-helix domain-containing protein [Chloroflexi bacterium]|nr:helix-hairpin-helix domain-containing protein [Chloroflexota bacterium]